MTATSAEPIFATSHPQNRGAPALVSCTSKLPLTAEQAAKRVLQELDAIPLELTAPQPWKTPLCGYQDRHVNYTAIVPLSAIPSIWHAGLWAYGLRHEGRCFDANESGHYLLPNWFAMLSDPTPEVVVAQLRQGAAQEGYPFLAWPDAGLTSLGDYLDVLQALRFLACALPGGTLGAYRVAIFMPKPERLTLVKAG
jgi:hypothetical protein